MKYLKNIIFYICLGLLALSPIHAVLSDDESSSSQSYSSSGSGSSGLHPSSSDSENSDSENSDSESSNDQTYCSKITAYDEVYLRNHPSTEDLTPFPTTESLYANLDEQQQKIVNNYQSRWKETHLIMQIAAHSGDIALMEYALYAFRERAQRIDDGVLGFVGKQAGGWTPLLIAASQGHIHAVEYLLQKRSSLYGSSDSFCSSSRNSALHAAISKSQLAMAEWLVANTGLDIHYIHKNAASLLSSAALYDQPKMVEWLVQHHKVDLHKQVKDSFYTVGELTLLKAARWASLDLLQLLAHYGINLHVVDSENQTLLDLATARGQLDTMKWLAQQGVATNIHKTYQHTLLHTAITSSCFELNLLEWILNQGADISAIDWQGNTAIDLLRANLPRINIPARREQALQALAFLESHMQTQQHNKDLIYLEQVARREGPDWAKLGLTSSGDRLNLERLSGCISHF